MSRIDITAAYDCPHCGAGFETADDAIYTDDIEDECAQKCHECGEWYQLRCSAVDITLEATKAAKPQADQSE